MFQGSPWLLAPAAVLVAFALAVLGDIAATFESRSTALSGHPGISILQTTVNGLNARDRVLQLFNFGSPLWALGLLVGLAVLALGEGRQGAGEPHQRSAHSLITDGYAGAAALALIGSLVDVVVWLTYLGASPALGVRSVLLDLGAAVVAAAVLWWSLDRRVRLHPAGVPAPRGGLANLFRHEAPAGPADGGDGAAAAPAPTVTDVAGHGADAPAAAPTPPAPPPGVGEATPAPPSGGVVAPPGPGQAGAEGDGEDDTTVFEVPPDAQFRPPDRPPPR